MAENLTNEHQKSNTSSYFLDELTKLVQVYFYFFKLLSVMRSHSLLYALIVEHKLPKLLCQSAGEAAARGEQVTPGALWYVVLFSDEVPLVCIEAARKRVECE